MENYSVGIHEKDEISLSELLNRIKQNKNLDEAGAIMIFIGIVRGTGKRGGKVKKLMLEAYKEQAEESLRKIAEGILERPGIVDVRIHHFVGELSVGEDIVYISVAGGHRGEVFEAIKEAIERMKKEAAIWKKEITDLGEYWVSGE